MEGEGGGEGGALMLGWKVGCLVGGGGRVRKGGGSLSKWCRFGELGDC